MDVVNKNIPDVFVFRASMPSTLRGPSCRRSARFVGTNHNSFSWPAKQVSHMDVVNKNIPDVFVAVFSKHQPPNADLIK
ncbi:MAG: hypothetical protein ACI965_001074 [Paraglaciecola sp.]|jgi:hypothetical protein